MLLVCIYHGKCFSFAHSSISFPLICLCAQIPRPTEFDTSHTSGSAIKQKMCIESEHLNSGAGYKSANDTNVQADDISVAGSLDLYKYTHGILFHAFGRAPFHEKYSIVRVATIRMVALLLGSLLLYTFSSASRASHMLGLHIMKWPVGLFAFFVSLFSPILPVPLFLCRNFTLRLFHASAHFIKHCRECHIAHSKLFKWVQRVHHRSPSCY